MEIRSDNDGKPTETEFGKPWKTHGSPMENRLKTAGKHVEAHGKHMEHRRKTDGNPMENRGYTDGKLIENQWKTNR